MSVSKAKVLGILQPIIAAAAGALATWLFVHLHFLSIFPVTHSGVAKLIEASVVFSVAAGLSWLGTHQHLIPVTRAVRMGLGAPVVPFTPKQIIAALTPYISIIAGGFASWIVVHLHVLGDFSGLQNQIEGAIAGALVFAVGAVLTWLSAKHHILPLLGVHPIAKLPHPHQAVMFANEGTGPPVFRDPAGMQQAQPQVEAAKKPPRARRPPRAKPAEGDKP